LRHYTEAERFRDTRSGELQIAEDAVSDEDTLLKIRLEALEAELADVRAKSTDASSRLRLAKEERREFEVRPIRCCPSPDSTHP
jgi:hypothetical protein